MPSAVAGPRLLAGRHPYAPLLTMLAAGATATLLTACGSSAPAQSTTAVKSACQQVSAVLSDGPDPGSDPVGYAEAQVKPLRQIHTGDHGLRTAVNKLSAAYQQFYENKGTGAAKQAVSQATHTVNTICPGAAS
jgi:hypothetical protein